MNKMKKLNHIGIAVTNLDRSIELYKNLGFEITDIEEIPQQKVRVAFVKLGESRIELLEPTSLNSPIAKFLEKKGPGIHHLAVEVDDIKGKLQELEKTDIRLIDKEARKGSHGLSIAFIHPKSTQGVLLELCEQIK